MSDPDIDRITENFRDRLDGNPHVQEFAAWLSDEVKDALLEYKSLLDQKHVPSKEWTYCPECGSSETFYEEGDHRTCKSCSQEWFLSLDYSEVVQRNLSKLHALATELNKERGVIDGLVDQWSETNSSLQRENDQLKQQLAEAERMRDNVLSDRNAIIAQGIAQSAMVEKLREALENWNRVYRETDAEYDDCNAAAREADEALALQPDQSLYERVVQFAKFIAECKTEEHGKACQCCECQATQLLADLGQPTNQD